MATWRLTVCFTTTITDRSGTKKVVDRTDSFDDQIATREKGLQKLPEFLEGRRREYGDQLRWVARWRIRFPWLPGSIPTPNGWKSNG